MRAWLTGVDIFGGIDNSGLDSLANWDGRLKLAVTFDRLASFELLVLTLAELPYVQRVLNGRSAAFTATVQNYTGSLSSKVHSSESTKILPRR